MSVSRQKVAKLERWKRLERDGARRDHLQLVARVHDALGEVERTRGAVEDVAGWMDGAETAGDRAMFDRYEEALRWRLAAETNRLMAAEVAAERQRQALAEAHVRVRVWETYGARIDDRAREKAVNEAIREQDDAWMRRR